MIIASHVVFTAYGFWLPNDERGSWSDFVRRWELYCLAQATKVSTRHSRAGSPFNRNTRQRASNQLRYPPVEFTGEQARCIASGLAEQVHRSGFVVHACAILPRHVHLVVRRHRFDVEQVVNLLKGAATRSLIRSGLHPMALEADSRLPSPWTSGLWKVFLDSRFDVERSIDYVNTYPLKEGKRAQQWKFVVPYE